MNCMININTTSVVDMKRPDTNRVLLLLTANRL